MVVGGRKGNALFDISAVLTDNLLRELKILKSIYALVLFDDLLLGNALLYKVALHALRLGYHLVASLSARRNKVCVPAALHKLLALKCDRAVYPASEKRRRRTVAPDRAAQNDNIFLIIRRSVAGRQNRANHR